MPPPLASPLSLVLPFLSRSSSDRSLVGQALFLPLPPVRLFPASPFLCSSSYLPRSPRFVCFFLLDLSTHSRPLQTPHTPTPPRSQHSHNAFRWWPRTSPLASLLFARWNLPRRSEALATPKPFPRCLTRKPALTRQGASPCLPPLPGPAPAPPGPRGPPSSPPARPPACPPLQTRSAGWAGSLRTHSCEEGVRAGLDPRTPRAGGSWT